MNFADHNEQALYTTIEPYRLCLETLFLDLFERTKSLRSILGLRRATYSMRDLGRDAKPFTRLQNIFLQGVKEQWSNRRIAIALDEAGLRPRSPDRFKSYVHMLGVNAQCFYSLKNQVKMRFRAQLTGSVIPVGPNLN